MSSFLSKLSDGINVVVEKITILLFVVLTVLTTIGVINRFIFSSPIVWLYQFTVVVFAWVIFFGVSIAFKKGEHIQLNFLTNSVPGKYKKIILIIIKLLIILFLFIVVKDGIGIIKNTISQKYQTIDLSIAWFYASLPVNAIISLIHLTVQVMKLLFERETVFAIEKSVQ